MAQVVANAFVECYYKVLLTEPESFYKFYEDSSMLSWPGPDGEMTSVKTIKLRNSLIHGGRETCESFCDPNDDNDYDNEGFDFGPSDFDMPENAYEYEEVPLQPKKHDDGSVCFETNEHEDPSSQASLEDLC
ncbi:hypothetical protein LOK49_LG05G01186 [Camellia lanceoleosa]|uniref:Uncharacterized protein n=1 Tax=Camellia lanceoleosa TaxID=1840588 RepID=A0ACC0HPN2_9ERIC|nr:hypothetical protein LOK49_LG05G01186 [Camellia lanceoleosa]